MNPHTSALRCRLFLIVSAFALAWPLRAAPTAWRLGAFERPDDARPVLGPGNAVFRDPITGAAVAWEKDHVFNPAAVTRKGRIYLLYRAEDDSGEGIGQHTSRIGLAESRDGLHFTRRPTPVLYPMGDAQKKDEWPGGCEDPRVVEAPDGRYVMTYTQWNRKTARLAVATSRDLVRWTKHGSAFTDLQGGRFQNMWSKSGSIVTKRVGDRLVAAKLLGVYWMYFGEGTMYAATSEDLIHWEPVLNSVDELLPIMQPRRGRFDSALCEPGPPAVLMDNYVILLYNGKNADTDGERNVKPRAYSGGYALMDAGNPLRIAFRSGKPFLSPQETYEDSGQYVAGTVFMEALVHFKNRWWLYFGAADSHIGVAMTDILSDDECDCGSSAR